MRMWHLTERSITLQENLLLSPALWVGHVTRSKRNLLHRRVKLWKSIFFKPQNPYVNKVHMNISWPIHKHCTIQTRAKPQHGILRASSACKHNHFAWHLAINSDTKELQALINTREHWAWGLAIDFNSLESEWAWISLHGFTPKRWSTWILRFVVGTQGEKRCSIYF